MWSPTAVRPSTPPWERPADLRTCWSGWYWARRLRTPVRLIPNRMIQACPNLNDGRPAFLLVKGRCWAWLDLNQRPHPYQLEDFPEPWRLGWWCWRSRRPQPMLGGHDRKSQPADGRRRHIPGWHSPGVRGARRGDAEPGVRPRVVVRPRLLEWPGGPIGGAVPDGGRRSRRSWGVGRRPPGLDHGRLPGWTSGPRRACSSGSRRCCWTSWARPAASTWKERCMATKRMTIVAAEPTCATAASGPASLGA
jgi:hypothetical protein